jgi:hypothetical protein
MDSSQFLLQADFLLPANREDVHIDSAWNKALATAAAIAYVNAACHMGNTDNALHYNWVRYVPVDQATTQFFDDLRQDILTKLRQSQILDSQSGRKRKPEKLIMVPTTWRDPSGRPFMSNRSNEDGFLAGRYDKDKDWRYLSAIGVKLMDENVFHDQMAKVLNRNPASFLGKKSKEWHSSFARALMATNKSRCSSHLPIIPLRSGKWVESYARGPFFFADSMVASTIPEGIEIDIVDSQAAVDVDRRKLFVQLGIRDLETSHIRHAIRTKHGDNKFKPDSLQPDVLVSHAEFLFTTGSGAVDDSFIIWMAADQGSCRQSNTMYLPSDIPGAASNILPKGARKKYGFLHSAYLKVGGSNKKRWFDYLQKYHKVSVYPRLFNDSTTKAYGCPPQEHIHDDFKLIIQGSLDQKCLVLLRDGWTFYNEWLWAPSSPSAYVDKACADLINYLKELQVRCTGSVQSEQIQNTYAPLDKLTKEYGTIAPFLDIPAPSNPEWVPLLNILAVGTEDDTDFYLKCLSGARINGKIPLDKIRHIMHEIEDRLEGGASQSQVR